MSTQTGPRDKTRRVYDHVMERIVAGDFAAGDPIHIGTLASETGVSLIPVREALRRLESEGLVEFEFHRGARVAQLGPDGYRDVMQTQAVLEGLAVSLSAPLLTAEELDRARELNAEMDAAHERGDFHGYNESSLEFHGLLQSRCPNHYLRDTLQRGQLRVAAMRASVIGYRDTITERLSQEHVELVDRIAAGAPAEEIEALMRAHRAGTLAHDTAGIAARSAEEDPDDGDEPMSAVGSRLRA